MLYAQMPVRLQADLISQPPVGPIDANTGLPIQFWRAQGLSIAVGIFDVDGNAVDLSNLTYLQLVLQETQSSLVPTVVKTVEAGDIIPVIPRAQWLANQNQQATFVFSNAELDLSLDGASEATYWLMLLGATVAGTTIVYAAGPVRVFNPGGSVPPPVTNATVSAHEQTSSGGDLLVSPASQLHLEEITVSGAAGTRNVTVFVAGLVKGARVSLRFKLPATDGINFRIFDSALSGSLLTTISSMGDGFTPAARIELWFDGVNLQRDFLVIPAFGQQN